MLDLLGVELVVQLDKHNEAGTLDEFQLSAEDIVDTVLGRYNEYVNERGLTHKQEMFVRSQRDLLSRIKMEFVV